MIFSINWLVVWFKKTNINNIQGFDIEDDGLIECAAHLWTDKIKWTVTSFMFLSINAGADKPVRSPSVLPGHGGRRERARLLPAQQQCNGSVCESPSYFHFRFHNVQKRTLVLERVGKTDDNQMTIWSNFIKTDLMTFCSVSKSTPQQHREVIQRSCCVS